VTEKSATPVLAAIKGRRTMKYICLGYYDKSKHDAMTEAEKQAMFDACFTYDDHLRANGNWVGGEPILMFISSYPSIPPSNTAPFSRFARPATSTKS
jgi:hypothetical protein